jgi:hypothetical protein
MTTITNILRKGLATKGNSFKINYSELIKESGMTEDDVCIALNSITQWNAWNMVILN